MKTTTEVLRSLVADIEAMKAKRPIGMDVLDVEGEQEHWFGGFERGWWCGWCEQDFRFYIQWPNLGILLEEAKQALRKEEL